MSLHDESFPNDLYFDEFDSPENNSGGQRFQFPNNMRQKQKQQQKEQQQQQQQQEFEFPTNVTTKTTTTTTTSTNTSSSFSDQQNLSTESSNGRPPSDLSSKTTESDPTGLIDSKKNSKNFDTVNKNIKSASYQDIQNIHSEYKKRRFKHVESKVGQYIANMKAQDEKRRNAVRFQRHRSMPETFNLCNINNESTSTITAEAAGAAATKTTKVIGLLRYSANELHNKNEFITNELASNSCENIISLGSSLSSSSSLTNSVNNIATINNNNNNNNMITTNFIDKVLYIKLFKEKERIQSHSNRLQTKLDEKISENIKLELNADFMRIELNNCKDQLKKHQSVQELNLGSLGSLNCINNNSRFNHFHQLFRETTIGCTKTTQTDDELLYLSNDLTATAVDTDTFKTPPTLLHTSENVHNKHLYENIVDGFGMGAGAVGAVDAVGAVNNKSTINCKLIKNVNAIQPISLNFNHITEQDIMVHNDKQHQLQLQLHNEQPILRQRNNSNNIHLTTADDETKTLNCSKNNINQISSSSYPSSSSDSAINLDVIELASPKHKRTNNNKMMLRSSTPPDDESRDEFLYFDKHTGRCMTLDTLNASTLNNENDDVNGGATVSTTNNRCGRKKTKNNKRSNVLRRRWLSIFGVCMRTTEEPEQVMLDTSNNINNGVMQRSYTQVPLLEKSFTNHCRNLR